MHLHDPTAANDPARELATLQEFVNSTFADPDVFGRDGDVYAKSVFKRQSALEPFYSSLDAAMQVAVAFLLGFTFNAPKIIR